MSFYNENFLAQNSVFKMITPGAAYTAADMISSNFGNPGDLAPPFSNFNQDINRTVNSPHFDNLSAGTSQSKWFGDFKFQLDRLQQGAKEEEANRKERGEEVEDDDDAEQNTCEEEVGQEAQSSETFQNPVFAQALVSVNIFGGERDNIISRWNYLQLSWGQGKLYYSQNDAPANVTPDNELNRFKGIVYCRIPNNKQNSDGLVGIIFNEPIPDVKSKLLLILQCIQNSLGSNPNLLVHIYNQGTNLRHQTMVELCVVHNSTWNVQPTRILATDLANFLGQEPIRSQLSAMGVCDVIAMVDPTENELKRYLKEVPKGFNVQQWRKAQRNNPHPEKLIPVPLYCFRDLKTRTDHQEEAIARYTAYMEMLKKEARQLRERCESAASKILAQKKLAIELQHRLLKVVINEDCARRHNDLPLNGQEEMLNARLTNIHPVISIRTEYCGRLSELFFQMRRQRNQFVNGDNGRCTLENEEEIKSAIEMKQKSIEDLLEIVRNDAKDLQIMSTELRAMASRFHH